MHFFVGTSGYAYKEWKGAFYPEKIASAKMLGFYSERLGAVEINNTFYRLPKQSVMESWARQVPDDFVFAIKASRLITHIKRLKDVESNVEYLFKSLSLLQTKLGPVLFQFPESFRANRPALEGFLNLMPCDVSCAFAFRSPSWLDAGIADLLRERGHTLCIEDTDEHPATIIGTASWGYLRLRRSNYSDAELSQWAREIHSQGWERAFVFIKHESEAISPQTALRFIELATGTA